MDIRRHRNKDQVVQALADTMQLIQADAIKERGRFSLALAGGSTPKALYELLAANQSGYQWDKWYIFFGDERTVPPDDADSNYHMAKDSLLSKVPIPESQIFRMKGELDPAVAADQYTQDLKATFGDQDFPRFDLILLGMGDDGHTASLFPHTAAIHESEKWVIAHFVEKLDTWRITLTPPVLNNARNIVFLVTGDKKAQRLIEVLNGDYKPDELPSQIINPTDGHLIWYVDEDAASQLP